MVWTPKLAQRLYSELDGIKPLAGASFDGPIKDLLATLRKIPADATEVPADIQAEADQQMARFAAIFRESVGRNISSGASAVWTQMKTAFVNNDVDFENYLWALPQPASNFAAQHPPRDPLVPEGKGHAKS